MFEKIEHSLILNMTNFHNLYIRLRHGVGKRIVA